MATDPTAQNILHQLNPPAIHEVKNDESCVSQSIETKEIVYSESEKEGKPKENLAFAEEDRILITICTGNRRKRKAFMSMPNRKDVIEKAHKYGLTGTTLVLESNGCEICEDEVLVVFAKEKNLLMLLSHNEEYIPLPQPVSVALKRDKISNCTSDPIFYGDNMIVTNANDSTLSNDETLSLTSITPNDSTTIKSSPQFIDFTIPWQKVPEHVMKLLREKKSLGKRINILATILVDELRERFHQISTRTFRQIAQQAAEKYPDSLLEKDREGQLISTTPQLLISKMINRNNILKKPEKRSNSNIFEIHISSKKRKPNDGTSSSNDDLNAAITSCLEKKKHALIESHRSGESIGRDIIINYMKECFTLQRSFFNNSEKIPDISTIKDNWPYIFDRDLLYQHFEILMSINPRSLESQLKVERERIFKYFKNSKNKKISALTESDSNVFRGLAYYFNENPDFIFKFFEHDADFEYVENANPTNAPWVALIKNNLSSTENEFKATIFIEGKEMVKITSEDSSLADIIAQLLCYYYTFNMMYPKEATQTLEFIVIYFLKHKIEQYRGLKKMFTGNAKYNQLIAKLSNMNC